MALEEYRKKRSFSDTPEPEGSETASGNSLVFVVQRHSATRLHYDFRLEMDGVLKSWAVPKGPSLNPADKRLAMMTEDHPFSYKDFEGSIPEGNYGAGEVEIWDSGTYEPLLKQAGTTDDSIMRNELQKESLKFVLHGNKLKGEFALVKIKNSKDANAWLLIKHKDAYALDYYDAEEFVPLNSKVTAREEKRSDKKISKKNSSAEKLYRIYTPALAGSRKLNTFIRPMLARPHDKAFDSTDWVFEIKWDGYRAVADLRGNKTELYSRNGLSYAEKFIKIVQALEDQEHEMVLDGEIVAFNSSGKPDFQALQKIGENPNLALTFQVFDLLWLNGHSTERLTLLQRKELLKDALLENEVIRYCEHIPGSGVDFFSQIKKMDLEGMIAKKADSTYTEGLRTENWLKIKFQNTEDVAICGFTEPQGERTNFGALILGTFIDGQLVYAGHVGTGFSEELLKSIYNQLSPFITEKCPFETVPKTNTPATWVEPAYVAEIKYTEKTADGIFRHPVFMGIRSDKSVADLDEGNHISEPLSKINQDEIPVNTETVKTVQRKPSGNVKLTNLDKIYFPESDITKGQLIEYYQSVSEYILPHLKGRPQSLNRFPNGITGLSFYHKDAGEDAPDWIEKTSVHSESSEKDIRYLICNTKDDLAYLNNLGCIDLNPWNSTVKNPENPDWLALDLDPSDGNTFDQVIETALVLKEVLDRANIKGYCKTSGSSGIHIFLPMGTLYEVEQVKNFAHILMQQVQKKLPDLTTLERSLKKRSKDKIYLDYLQNRTGQTLASVYSVRPKPYAPVSMPLHWEELKPGLQPTDFTIANALERIKKNGDLFRPVLEEGIDMLNALENLAEN